jgi:2'-hydroxyisoflavone reductase
MKLLILGGTVFLGRHLVDAALANGHAVTTFTRGEHPAPLDPAVEQLHGNRKSDLAALEGRVWDAVIDTSGYVPRELRMSTAALARTGHYTFISSISVYADFKQRGKDEGEPVGTLEDPTVEDITGGSYGPLKALCEAVVREARPESALIIRPGLIVGPYDPTDRFTYWPHRVAAGGAVLAPGQAETQVQFIDVRDLAEWTLRMAEAGRTGTFNATGPTQTLAMGTVLETCRAVSGSDARFIWVAEPFLEERQVGAWMDMPLWIPVSDTDSAGHSAVNCQKAIAAGLTFRPLAETVRATLDWDATRPADRAWKAGLTREREAEVLAAWHAAEG